ncbi:MAG TPA: Wzz/FepE/Etk N-terminal domain-containing protein, partial [Rheinheimera sp.]|uniref:Wzz/FepE/Etk N-terminal domain-containing protein n=1 Tax=Rheinheimera sp. TaxID=1869214 RepID=UPI002F941488
MSKDLTNDVGYANDEIGLNELFSEIWRVKFWLGGISFLVAVIVAAYSLTLPNIYRSEALVVPVEDGAGGKLGSLAGQFGGLASLAGISLGKGDSNKSVIALEKLKSREFFFKFAEKHQILVPLMAVKEWDPQSDKLVLDADIYNADTDTWVRNVSWPKQPKPSLQEAHKAFLDSLTVSQDKTTGMVKIMLEHVSPTIARDWTTALITDLNEEMRQRDIAEAQSSIAYLEQQVADTKITEIKTVLYQLIEEQTKTLMLANVKPEYILETVDAAIVPEKKYKPGRAVMVIGAAVVVFIGG